MFCWLRLSSRDARPGSTNENSRVSVIKRSRKKKKKTNSLFGYFKSSSAVVKDIFHIYGVDSRNKGYAKIHMEKKHGHHEVKLWNHVFQTFTQKKNKYGGTW